MIPGEIEHFVIPDQSPLIANCLLQGLSTVRALGAGPVPWPGGDQCRVCFEEGQQFNAHRVAQLLGIRIHPSAQ